MDHVCLISAYVSWGEKEREREREYYRGRFAVVSAAVVA